MCRCVLSPVGPIRERLRNPPHLYPLRGASEAGDEEKVVVGVGRWGVIAGRHVSDGFQPCYVTLISYVVTLASSLVSPPRAAHMPLMPGGDGAA